MTTEPLKPNTTEFRCPTCSATFWADKSRKSLPFCSERCQMIDLNRWFNQEIGIPHEPSDDDLAEEPELPVKEYRFD